MPSLEELITPTPYFGICIEEKETDLSLFAIGIICCSNQIDTADEKALSQTRMTADKCRTNDRFRKPPIGSLLCSPSLGQGLPTDVKSISKLLMGNWIITWYQKIGPRGYKLLARGKIHLCKGGIRLSPH